MDTTDEGGDNKTGSVDMVNHPPHYTNHPSGVEIIEMTRWMPFNLGNAFKYIARANLKNSDPLEDLKKAQWYINDYADNHNKLLPFRKVLWESAQQVADAKADKFFEDSSTVDCLHMIFIITRQAVNKDFIESLQLAIHDKVREATEQQNNKTTNNNL